MGASNFFATSADHFLESQPCDNCSLSPQNQNQYPRDR